MECLGHVWIEVTLGQKYYRAGQLARAPHPNPNRCLPAQCYMPWLQSGWVEMKGGRPAITTCLPEGLAGVSTVMGWTSAHH